MGPMGMPELLFLTVVTIGAFAIAIGVGKGLSRILSEELRKILGGIALITGLVVVIYGIISINSARAQIGQAIGRPELGGVYAIPIGILVAVVGITLIVSRGSSKTGAPSSMKKCPFCAETIQSEAKICRFCQRNLSAFE